MIARSDIVKVSDEDLDWLLPAPLSLRDKVAKLMERGPSVVIMTRGKDGASGFLADGSEVRVPAQRVEIKDTVGAGDTFNAGFLAKLSELECLTKTQLATLPSDTLQRAMEHGAKAAAITVSRAGANPPWAEEF
jgi:fructokinase